MTGLVEGMIAIVVSRILGLINTDFAKDHPWVGYSILLILVILCIYFIIIIIRNKNWQSIRKYALAIGCFFAIWGILMATRG
jgi:hypothetical protein